MNTLEINSSLAIFKNYKPVFNVVGLCLLMAIFGSFLTGCISQGVRTPDVGGATSSSPPSKCFVCSGMGYKKDPNSGKTEMCNYCNGAGVR